MNLSLKSIASWFTLLLLLIQFMPLHRLNPPLISEIEATPPIKNALKKGCYDCHSNATRWSGLAYIAPFSWLISGTVTKGRSVLNFSEWKNEKNPEQLRKRAKINQVIADAEAHQQLYYLWNPRQRLTVQESNALQQWLHEPH